MKISSISKFFYVIKSSWKVSFYTPKKAIFDILLMFVSRIILLSIWYLFFRAFEEVNGWYFQQVAVLLAIIAGAYGILQVFFGGLFELPDRIMNGNLDLFLIKPISPLWGLLCSKSLLRGWGDFIYIIVLLPIANIANMKMLILLLFGIVSSAAICLSVNIIIMSLVFWLRSCKNLVHKYYTVLLIFCSYPPNVYTGFLRILLFTIIPAGLIGFLPVRLIDSFSWTVLFLLLFVDIVFIFLANFIFFRGLRNYVSNNYV